jgi:hypothetical protein
MLGVPTIADRVAQTVVAMHLEPLVEPKFHPDSYGYRPGKAAHHAIGACRARCWKYDWVIDLDVRKFFDTVPWDLVVKAVTAVCTDRWVLLYVKRWLAAPLQHADGTLAQRTKGTPQGSAVSPVLANLFMHYAFDLWMVRTYPGCPFERYADDGVPRTLKEDRCRRRYRRMRCCTRDGGWPSAVALQGEIANHRGVRRSRAGVLSVAEKARRQRVRCGSRRRAKANHRRSVESVSATSKTGVESLPWDELGGSLLTGQVGVRHGWWRERGLGSRVELGNLSPRSGGRPVEWCCPAAGRLEREPQAADLRGGE